MGRALRAAAPPPQQPPRAAVCGCRESSRALSPRGERWASVGELGVEERRVVRAATSHIVCVALK